MEFSRLESNHLQWSKTIPKLLRVHQYAKNLLLFFPWILGHQYLNVAVIKNLSLAFIALSLLASSSYILNDLLDLESDRNHRIKKYRVLASSALTPSQGIIIASICFLASLVFAVTLPPLFKLIMAIYFAMSLLYSFFLKRKLLLDVIVLSCLYTLRVLGGMALINLAYSDWILLFSLFFFTSLAFLKRYTELFFHEDCDQALQGRGYMKFHIQLIQIFGICSGYLSVLVVALYLHSHKAAVLYTHPDILYASCPLFLYWISRTWLIAASGSMHEDPVVFAMHDRTTYLVIFLITVIGVMATY